VRKPAARRFLEFIGLARSTNDPTCPTTESTSATSTSTKGKGLSKAQGKKLKQDQDAAKAVGRPLSIWLAPH
jgi:hypothetical protein